MRTPPPSSSGSYTHRHDATGKLTYCSEAVDMLHYFDDDVDPAVDLNDWWLIVRYHDGKRTLAGLTGMGFCPHGDGDDVVDVDLPAWHGNEWPA